MQTKLVAFLHRSAERPFRYGRNDCCLLVAGWWQDVHGFDPAKALRDSYSSEDEKDALVAQEGGLLPLVSSLAASVGARPIDEPGLGDFAVIEYLGKPFGAICAGTAGSSLCWAIRTQKGVGFLINPKILQAWAINDPVAA